MTDIHLSDANPTDGADPSLQVTLFAKIYDVAPDGSKSLVHNLVAPLRVADLSRPVHINLPGVVHRYAKDHAIDLVIATTDAAYTASRGLHNLTITVDPNRPSRFALPVLRGAAPLGTVGGGQGSGQSGVQQGDAAATGRQSASGQALSGGQAANARAAARPAAARLGLGRPAPWILAALVMAAALLLRRWWEGRRRRA
jgi:hypothetical protein